MDAAAGAAVTERLRFARRLRVSGAENGPRAAYGSSSAPRLQPGWISSVRVETPRPRWELLLWRGLVLRRTWEAALHNSGGRPAEESPPAEQLSCEQHLASGGQAGAVLEGAVWKARGGVVALEPSTSEGIPDFCPLLPFPLLLRHVVVQSLPFLERSQMQMSAFQRTKQMN